MARFEMRVVIDTERPMGPQVLAAFIAGIPDKIIAALLSRSDRTLRYWRERAEAPDPLTVTFHVKQDVAGFPERQTIPCGRSVAASLGRDVFSLDASPAAAPQTPPGDFSE